LGVHWPDNHRRGASGSLAPQRSQIAMLPSIVATTEDVQALLAKGFSADFSFLMHEKLP